MSERGIPARNCAAAAMTQPPDWTNRLLQELSAAQDQGEFGRFLAACIVLIDPWQHHIYLVLQNGATGELFTFATSTDTGRRAAGNLLRHYDRLTRTHPDMYPVVRL